MRARLYLDEDVLPDLARILRSAGHDVVSAHEAQALGLSDEEQLERAASDRRVLLSFNYRDFLRIAREWYAAERPHAGIVISYRQYGVKQLRELRGAVVALLASINAEEMQNRIWILDQFRRS